MTMYILHLNKKRHSRERGCVIIIKLRKIGHAVNFIHKEVMEWH